MSKKKYVIVGTGGRAEFFYGALVTVYNETSELAAFCDVNQTRMNFANHMLTDKYGYHEVPTYKAEDFDLMIEETRPDFVLVTTIDRTHHKYIIRAMEQGGEFSSEKPITMYEQKGRRIFETT
ncbi:dehydrogenase, partial [Paenibacillus riograndensis]